MREGDTLIVSEPLADLPGAWHEIPESTAVVVEPGGTHELQRFSPHVAAPRPQDSTRVPV
jgi:glutamine amidotransferase